MLVASAETNAQDCPMIDDRDRVLLALLQADADMPLAAMADRVALSPSACSRRVQRLREAGYILRRVALLDRRRMAVPTTVFALLRSGRHTSTWAEALRQIIQDVPEIVEAHRLTGNFDYVLKLVLPTAEHYDQVYKRLTDRVELVGVSAYISMEVLKAETAVPTHFAE